MNAPNSPVDPWVAGSGYENYMGRWSRRLAPQLVRWAAVPPGRRWLDVGCGTGALSAAILAEAAPASLTGIDPSEGFLAVARSRLPAQVALLRASAAALPLADVQVDATAACLVLNFVPDPLAALREMRRVTTAGGRVAACVWDYAQRMELTGHYWAAAAALGLLAPGEAQSERYPICAPDALATAFAAAGLREVDVAPLELEMRFTGFDDYWQPFLAGQGVPPAHAMRLPEATRERLREALRERLPVRPDGSIVLAARAWAACATVA